MSRSGEDGSGGGKTVYRPASPLQSRKKTERPGPPAALPGWDEPSPPPPPRPETPDPADYSDPPPLSRAGMGPAEMRLAPSRLAEDDVPLPRTSQVVRNRLIAEAAPILALAASVRAGRVSMPLPQLHREALAAIAAFERAIAPYYPKETLDQAKYAVCGTVDDIAQNLPNLAVDGAEWAKRSMTVHFYREWVPGERLWKYVDGVLRHPRDNADLIELFHACVAAGFEGAFRPMPDGKRRLHEVTALLQGAIEHVRALSDYELTPRWRGEKAPPGKPAFWNLIALAAAGGAAFLLLAYLFFLLILMSTNDAPSRQLAALLPDERLALSRSARQMPQPDSSQKQALEGFLAQEIRDHEVTVVEDGQTVRVRTTIGELFRSGSDQLEAGREPLFVKIGKAIENEQGPVLIEGHADTDRISTAFPDNKALSEARANTIAAIIRSQLTDPARVSIEGKGSDVPLASNDTPEGKAQNRRVEIIVPRRN